MSFNYHTSYFSHIVWMSLYAWKYIAAFWESKEIIFGPWHQKVDLSLRDLNCLQMPVGLMFCHLMLWHLKVWLKCSNNFWVPCICCFLGLIWSYLSISIIYAAVNHTFSDHCDLIHLDCVKSFSLLFKSAQVGQMLHSPI